MRHYVRLHGHEDGSCTNTGNDGGGTAVQNAVRAKRLGMQALFVTEHGNVYGFLDHYKACEAVGLKAGFGIEIYHQKIFCKMPTKDECKQNGYTAEEVADFKYRSEQYHLTLIVKNNTGWKNLMQMLTVASREYFYYHPVVDNALLEQYADGLFCLSGCMGGHMGQHILAGKIDDARDQMLWLKSIFKENFYLEVMPHTMPGQDVVNRQLEVWSDAHHIPIVATDDSHYPDHYESYKKLLAMRKYPEHADYSQLYMHSEAEMIQLCMQNMHCDRQHAEEYVYRSGEIADACHVTFDNALDMPLLAGVEDQNEELKKRCLKGLVQKRKYTVDENGKKHILPEYKKRFWYEYKLLTSKDKNFAGYMLLSASLSVHAKEMGYEVQGRGSVCNSLVAWLLGIHRIDPIRYDLDFERFFGMRKSMPDIDNDVPDDKGEELLAWMQQEYGNVVPIITFGKYKSQSLVNGLIKACGIENGDAQRFRDAITEMNHEDVQPKKSAMMQNNDLAYLEKNYGVVTHYCWLWGQRNTVSTHAAGLAITQHDITEKVAVVRSHDDKKNIVYATAFNMTHIEELLGILKMDVLKLKTLSVVLDAERHAGVKYTDRILTDEERADRESHTPFLYDDNDLECAAVMERFAAGDTLGIMQMETAVPTRLCKKMPPHSVRDVGLISSMNRPMNSAPDIVERVLDWKQGKGPQPVIFQQDVMRRCKLAGLDWEQIDRVLKSLKKKVALDDELKSAFVSGMMAHVSMIEEQAQEALAQLNGYGFEEGHATAYGHLSCRMMWLKVFHPFSFYLSLLQHSDKDNRIAYEGAAARAGIRLMIPSVNGGVNYREVITEEWTKADGTVVPERHYIQQGMVVLDGVGETRAAAIVEERLKNGDYISKIDFCGEDVHEQPNPKLRKKGRVPKAIANVAVVKALDDAGALCFDGKVLLERSRNFTYARRELPAVPMGKGDDFFKQKYRQNGHYKNGSGYGKKVSSAVHA